MNNQAVYAVNWRRDLGLTARQHSESQSNVSETDKEGFFRSPFQHDRDRIIHSNGFRWLMFKTQVFVINRPSMENFRTRLTHTIEVAQMARSLARALHVDEDLTEAIALAHDLGHPPFGHAGERVLNAALSDQGGFDHNVQSFRIVTQLERRYLGFDGLNLCRASLEGIIKHNGALAETQVPNAIAKFCQNFPLDLSSEPSLEAQIAGIADDLAYNSHDLDDGLRAGLFGLKDLLSIPFLAEIAEKLRRDYVNPPNDRFLAELIRRFINLSLRDVIAETSRNIAELNPRDAAAIAASKTMLVKQSADFAATHQILKNFLRENMYHHEIVMTQVRRGEELLREFFAKFRASPSSLPSPWREYYQSAPSARKKNRVIADFLASGNMPERQA